MAVSPRNPSLGKPSAQALQDPRAQEEAARQDRHRNEDLADACSKIEEELEALKARYEMYFLGIERREPVREREEMKRRVAHLKGEFIRNTGLRFRVQTLHARFLSYERMWMRSAREREQGTYKRDLARLRRRDPVEPPAPPAAPPAAAPSPSKAAPPPPPPAIAGLSEAKLRALYDEYLGAKKRCGEDVSRFTYETLARTVAKQVPELIARYAAKTVDFRVEVKDGRAVLKVLPRV
ncbi:MAG TPA: MXAN_5187 C-terminal domain-containing protein [Anaeromyxobacteraceae bacterium]|nr:MXAN_5187 C-terminal domain-containing protein [Anaeromyxobacteraceae bacterium]